MTIWESPTSWPVAHPRRTPKAVTGAVKIDSEIHGNTIPHLHMHLFDDPSPGTPIDLRRVEPPVENEGACGALPPGRQPWGGKAPVPPCGPTARQERLIHPHDPRTWATSRTNLGSDRTGSTNEVVSAVRSHSSRSAYARSSQARARSRSPTAR